MHDASKLRHVQLELSQLCRLDFCPELLQLILGHDIFGIQLGSKEGPQEGCSPPHPVMLPEPAHTHSPTSAHCAGGLHVCTHAYTSTASKHHDSRQLTVQECLTSYELRQKQMHKGTHTHMNACS